jgi:hypothetical protein
VNGEGKSGVPESSETIRIPGFRAVVGALATLVVISLVVFLRRYRAADRTALALSLLTGAGLCLVGALAGFQLRFRGERMSRRELRGIGLRWGAVAGLCTGGVGVVLLAVRWAIDQQSSPVGEELLQAFLRALGTLGLEMVLGLPAYLAVGAVVGALTGLALAEAIGLLARREPRDEPTRPGGSEPEGPSRMKA